MRVTPQSGSRQIFAFATLIIGICLFASTATADEKKNSTPKPSSGRGTSFADKEQNTELLKARRERVRKYEAALSRGLLIPAPDVPQQTIERSAPRERSPREKVLETLLKSPMDKSNLTSLKLYLSASTNSEERALLGTAYCLGCFATAQGQEASRISALMKNAYPDDSNVNLLSLKTFATDCRKCGGTGEIDKKCDKCKGKKKCQFLGCKGGTLSNPDLMITGKAPKCPQCGGTAECAACKGKGITKTRCTDCSGKGQTLSRESIEKGYVDYLRKIDR